MSSDDDTAEEIEEEIYEHSEEAARSLSESKGESLVFSLIDVQEEETTTADNWLSLNEAASGDEYKRIVNTQSLSTGAESHNDNLGNNFQDFLVKKNENGSRDKEAGEEEVVPKKPRKSLFQHKGEQLYPQIFKGISGSDKLISADPSPVSSDWSVESFRTHSTGSNCEYIKDRSVSEVSVSIPKLSVFSLGTAHKVSSLVKQFSCDIEETSDKPTESAPRRHSLPVELFQGTSVECDSLISLQHGKQRPPVSEESSASCASKDCVSSMVCHFDWQEKREHASDIGSKNSLRKLGQLSPRVKASVEKIDACLSRVSLPDSQVIIEERKILKNKENITFRETAKKVMKLLCSSQKENTPCHKTKLKESLHKIDKGKEFPKGRVKDKSECEFSFSHSISSIASPVKSMRTYSKKGNDNNENINVIDEATTYDTEEEVEDMPKELEQDAISCINKDTKQRDNSNESRNVIDEATTYYTEEEVEDEDIPQESEQNVINCVDKESDDLLVIEDTVLKATDPNISEPPELAEISCASSGKVNGCTSRNSLSESLENKISIGHNISPEDNRDDEVILSNDKVVKIPPKHGDGVDSLHSTLFEAENMSHLSESIVQTASSLHSDACDGRESNLEIRTGDAIKKDSICGSPSDKGKEKGVPEDSECLSGNEFLLSIENESCDELINIDFDHSGDEIFDDEFSDASEIVLEFISKSPISAITERTEESGQESENQNSRIESESDLCSAYIQNSLEQTGNNTISGNECQNNEQKVTKASAIGPLSGKHFPSLPLNIVHDDSSQFTGTSSVQGGSLVQTQVSIQTSSESVHPHSSQSSTIVVGQYSSKPGTKSKLPMLTSNIKFDKTMEKNATPPLSPTTKIPGPLRASLHRNSSRSLHNLASNYGPRSRNQGLHNRSISVSSDNLEGNCLRAKSLSPGPIPKQKIRCGSESGGQGNLNRRCISAIALNEEENHVNLKRNRSFSLNKLNRSRSSSMTSIASSKKVDYSQVTSKVRQYIKDMKDKDLRNSTRSLPSTPARKKMQLVTNEAIVLDEKLLRELSKYNEEKMPHDIRKIRDQIIGEKGDPKRLEEILKLLICERKSRYASDTTLAALQLRYDNLNAMFAEKQNEIDRLRFHKDIHINKEYSFTIKTQEERRDNSGRSSHNETPPLTPSRSLHHYLSSPNLSGRRSSYQVTPPNTPNIRSLSPTLTCFNFIKNTSTPIVDPNWNFAYDPSSSCVLQDSLPRDAPRDHHSPEADQDKNKDLERTESSLEGVSLQSWMKDANNILKRVKEFALLEGSAALQHSERNIIWHSILQQYWCLSSQFPMLTLLAPAKESGQLLQELGLALQATASRFDLDLVIDKCQKGGEVTVSCPNTVSGVDKRRVNENHIKNLSAEFRKFNQDGRGKIGTKEIVRDVSEQPRLNLESEVHKTQTENNQENGRLSHEQRSHTPLQYSSVKLKKEEHGSEIDIKLKTSSKNIITPKSKRSDVPAVSTDPPTSINQNDFKKNNNIQETVPVVGLIPHILEGPSGTDKIDISPLAACSPAHSRESMKTVGPLEKAKVPHTAYESSSTSPVPSMLSLNSSQPFDIHEDPNNSLTNLHLDSAQYRNRTGVSLPLDHATVVENKQMTHHHGHSIDCSSPKLESDLPRCSWRSNNVTPRLPWGKAIKVRDLDSGCPGSEQSTRMSHNASLDQPEQLDIPNFLSSLDATSNINLQSIIRIKDPQKCSFENEEYVSDCIYNEAVDKLASRSSTHTFCGDKNSECHADAAPSSDLIEMAFPESEVCQIRESVDTDITRKCRTLSGSRSSKGSSKNKLGQYYGHSESQDVTQKTGHERLLNDDHIVRNDSRRGTKSNNSDLKDTKINEDVFSQGGEFNNNTSYVQQRRMSQKESEKRTVEGKVKSKEWQTGSKMSSSVGIEQNQGNNVIFSPVNQNPKKQTQSYKYSARFVSGNISDQSEMSTSSRNSSSNIYNNISKLKRDLNIIKSQMMNLTSEVFHNKKTKGEGSQTSSSNKTSKMNRRQNPLKALDVSLYSEDSEHDSYITPPRLSHVQASKDQMHRSIRSRTTTHTKTKNKNVSEDFHNHYKSPVDLNYQDSQEDTSIQFSNSSLERLSESLFANSKMDNIPTSTPKNKKSNSRERKKDSSSPVKIKIHRERLKRKESQAGNIENTGTKQHMTDHKRTLKTLSFGHICSKHASVQTENREPIQTSNEEIITDVTQAKVQENQSVQVSENHRLSTTAPVIYIHNYNCGSETSKVCPDDTGKHKSSQHGSIHRKHRRSGSAQELMVSLDEATTLAERLRLRSENMLSYLNLHLSVHDDPNQP
ncbi:hypothetical protein Hamer_G009253 [Homarus americanus]|uniref:Uncharacterized protein n=1 Tax=Homarus americanus TaxID=6706 RepID=A0A8J5JFL3_HOMAM|nr:hypothetical protein Hamer_G009253 [Homarus americanus]